MLLDMDRMGLIQYGWCYGLYMKRPPERSCIKALVSDPRNVQRSLGKRLDHEGSASMN